MEHMASSERRSTLLISEANRPCRIRDVGLPARQVLGVADIDEHHLEGTIFEQIVEGLPIVAGGLHGD